MSSQAEVQTIQEETDLHTGVQSVLRPKATGQNAKASHRTWIHRGFSRERIDQSALQVSCGELLSLVDPE